MIQNNNKDWNFMAKKDWIATKNVTLVEIRWWGSEILILCGSVGRDLGENVETLNLGAEVERRGRWGKEWV